MKLMYKPTTCTSTVGTMSYGRHSIMYQYSTKDIERFWSKVVKSENDDSCWNWLAVPDRKGYGRFSIGGSRKNGGTIMFAHRVSWELAYGEIPDGLEVLHTCDNPPCVNPNHLFVGTQADNMRDMVAKGRSTLGEKNPMAKLTQSDIEEIRRRYKRYSRDSNTTTLAKEFGVCFQAIHLIISNKRWRPEDQ